VLQHVYECCNTYRDSKKQFWDSVSTNALRQANQIFDAFFTTKPQGSGMGLLISKSNVEAHGGRIWATVNEGRGATFHFTLPVATEELKVPAAKT
jgi:signal transduction histidine kinase